MSMRLGHTAEESTASDDWRDMSRFKRRFGYLIPVPISYLVTIIIYSIIMTFYLSFNEQGSVEKYAQNLAAFFLIFAFFGSTFILPIYAILCSVVLSMSIVENVSSIKAMVLWGALLGAGIGALFGPVLDLKGMPLIFLAAAFGALAGSAGGYVAAWLHNHRPIVSRS